jgi:hypothetical protein
MIVLRTRRACGAAVARPCFHYRVNTALRQHPAKKKQPGPAPPACGKPPLTVCGKFIKST